MTYLRFIIGPTGFDLKAFELQFETKRHCLGADYVRDVLYTFYEPITNLIYYFYLIFKNHYNLELNI